MRRRPDLPPPNLLERLIAMASPSWAMQRHQTRVALALNGGYDGAGYSERFARWFAGQADADSDTSRDLGELRGRSRDLVRNSAIASGAIETQVVNVIGTGLSLEPCPDADFLGLDDAAAEAWQEDVERQWCLWAHSKLCDVTAEQNFYGLQDLVLRSCLESGDVFPLLVSKRRPGWPFQLAIQVIEADLVSNPNRGADSMTLIAGVEKAEDGEPIAVHIASRNPNSYLPGPSVTWKRMEMRGADRVNVLHVKRKLRPGQTRGVPVLAPIIGLMKQLTRYSNAEVDAAVNSAVFTTFVKMDPEAFTDIFDDDSQDAIIDNAKRWDGTLRSGAAVNLLPGEEIQTPELGRPNPNFDGFFQAVVTQIGMSLGVPKEVLLKHFQASYSAARAALLDAWRTWRVRRDWIASEFCQAVYSEWLADAVALGRIKAPGFFSDPLVRAAWTKATWGGDGMGSIDPEKEVTAAKARVDMGLTTLDEEIMAYDGGDWSEKHERQVKIQEARVKDKLAPPIDVPQPGAAAPGKPADNRPTRAENLSPPSA